MIVPISGLLNKANNKLGYFAVYKQFLKMQKIQLGKNFFLKGMPVIKNKGIMVIGDNTIVQSMPDHEFCKTRIVTNYEHSVIHIGKNAMIRGTTIWASTKILIGDNFLSAPYAWIVDNDAHGIAPDKRANRFAEARPVVIGNNVWVGYRAMILKGVTIGDNCVIAAGAIVTRDIPSNSIAAGVPAAVVGSVEKR